jgi:hypothetical protein
MIPPVFAWSPLPSRATNVTRLTPRHRRLATPQRGRDRRKRHDRYASSRSAQPSYDDKPGSTTRRAMWQGVRVAVEFRWSDRRSSLASALATLKAHAPTKSSATAGFAPLRELPCLTALRRNRALPHTIVPAMPKGKSAFHRCGPRGSETLRYPRSRKAHSPPALGSFADGSHLARFISFASCWSGYCSGWQ